MHAELNINGARLFVNDVMQGMKGPKDLGGSSVALWIYCEDSDAVYNKAVAAGAKTAMPLDNQFWGDRAGAVIDPEGYTWWIATRKEDLATEEIRRRAEEFFKQAAGQAR